MKELLYLAHRIPYPPNKGDKVRSFNELKYLAKNYKVHLGAFIDDANDWQHVETLKQFCGETCFVALNSQLAKIKSVQGFLSGEALTLPYYKNKKFANWVKQILASRPIQHVLIYSSPMAQYVPTDKRLRKIADFVDVDSDKWQQYSKTKSWPLSWIYSREAKKLAAYERKIAAEFDATILVAPHEADLLRKIAPESADRIYYAKNGVDAEFFSPQHLLENPYSKDEVPLVFTGAMDYWPNIDAVEWFADQVYPLVKKTQPKATFYIVGARPAATLDRLKSVSGITITGSVADVRPYISHAALSVAPLRIARGIQNKVLEAMAMEKAVVVSTQAAAGIAADDGRDFVITETDANQFANAVCDLLKGDVTQSIGKAARQRVLNDYSWHANLSCLDTLLS